MTATKINLTKPYQTFRVVIRRASESDDVRTSFTSLDDALAAYAAAEAADENVSLLGCDHEPESENFWDLCSVNMPDVLARHDSEKEARAHREWCEANPNRMAQ